MIGHAVPLFVNREFASQSRVPRTAAENAQLRKFGANIRRERNAKALTQEQLAEMVDLNSRNIRKIEAGETNMLVTTLIRIRRALRCSADKLIPRE
jgi:DNA-binding XRE family transcriptional regulator